MMEKLMMAEKPHGLRINMNNNPFKQQSNTFKIKAPISAKSSFSVRSVARLCDDNYNGGLRKGTAANGGFKVTERLVNGVSHVVPGPPTVHRNDNRLKVAVDVDEVLGQFLHSLNKFCEEEYGFSHDTSDYFVYDFAKVWQCSQDESNHRVHSFFESHHFAAGIEVIPGAYESLSRLRDACELMVVTSRQHVIQEPTLEWINAHFPNIFSEVHFGNHFALKGSSRKKSEICHAIEADVLIDDNPGYAVECADAGIHVLLYDWRGKYPWSKTEQGGPVHERITRVGNWEEVELALLTLSAIK